MENADRHYIIFKTFSVHIMLIMACDADKDSGVFRGLGQCALSLPTFVGRRLSKCKMIFHFGALSAENANSLMLSLANTPK